MNPDVHLNETMFLASMLKSRDLLEVTRDMKLKPWFFEEKQNRDLYTEAISIYEQQRFESIAPVILGQSSQLSETYNVVMRSNPKYYLDLYREDDYILINLASHYKQARKRTELHKISKQIEKRIDANESHANEIALLDELRDDSVKADVMNGVEIVHAIDNEIVQEVFKTGIEELDSFVRLESSTLLVLAGESSSGKTSLANQLIYQFLSNTKLACMYFSLETTQVRLGKRFLRHIQHSSKTDRDGARKQIIDLGDRLVVSKLCSSIEGIRDNILAHQKKDDRLKFIVVDYLQIVNVKGITEEKDRVAYVAKALHELAQEFGYLIILLCQLRKEDFSKSEGKLKRSAPTMHDLRGSAQIANCADYIFINQNKDVHVDVNAKLRDVAIYCVKNKEGSQGKVDLMFHGASFSFIQKHEAKPC